MLVYAYDTTDAPICAAIQIRHRWRPARIDRRQQHRPLPDRQAPVAYGLLLYAGRLMAAWLSHPLGSFYISILKQKKVSCSDPHTEVVLPLIAAPHTHAAHCLPVICLTECTIARVYPCPQHTRGENVMSLMSNVL